MGALSLYTSTGVALQELDGTKPEQLASARPAKRQDGNGAVLLGIGLDTINNASSMA